LGTIVVFNQAAHNMPLMQLKFMARLKALG